MKIVKEYWRKLLGKIEKTNERTIKDYEYANTWIEDIFVDKIRN